MDKCKVLVVVVTYNGKKWIDNCLTSVVQSSLKSDLFIVDNGSTDGTVDYIKDHYPYVNLHIATSNLGFGRANNIGLKYALENDYDYVYLLNQDAWIEEEGIEHMVKLSQKHEQYGILSPLQVNRDKMHLDKNFADCCSYELKSDAICGVRMKPIYEVEFAMAAHWLLPKKCIEEVGGFSWAFEHYGEDDNYAQRVKSKGFKIGVVSSVKGVHDRGERPVTRERRIFFSYISNLVLLNNPTANHRFIRVVCTYIGLLITDPKQIQLKYIAKLFTQFFKARHYRKMYNKNCPFL